MNSNHQQSKSWSWAAEAPDVITYLRGFKTEKPDALGKESSHVSTACVMTIESWFVKKTAFVNDATTAQHLPMVQKGGSC